MIYPRKSRFRRDAIISKLEVTKRDEEIIHLVHRHRFLRSSHITDLVSGSRQQILRRLQLLFHHGYLERPICQLDYYRKGGSRSIVYGLASSGAAFLRRVDNIPFSKIDWSGKNQSVKRVFLDHALMVSDIMVALELACNKRDDIRLLVASEIPLPETSRKMHDPFRWTVAVSCKEKIGVIPDKVFALEFAQTNERILFFLEADRGTMPVERTKGGASSIKQKLQCYTQSWKSQIHTSRFGFTRVRVLTVTLTEKRRLSIDAAVSGIAEGNGIFLQTHIASNFHPEILFG